MVKRMDSSWTAQVQVQAAPLGSRVTMHACFISSLSQAPSLYGQDGVLIPRSCGGFLQLKHMNCLKTACAWSVTHTRCAVAVRRGLQSL